MNYNPYDWYWFADDGRVFSSARQTTVDEADADYVAWSQTNAATQWPRDDAGNQTDAALQAVLLPYNLFVDLKGYSASARFEEETGGITVNGYPVNTDRVTQAALASAYNLSKEDPATTFSYKLGDGTFITLDATQIPALATGVSQHTQSCFAAEAQLQLDIDAGTVTTHAQVDDVYAAIPDVVALQGLPNK